MTTTQKVLVFGGIAIAAWFVFRAVSAPAIVPATSPAPPSYAPPAAAAPTVTNGIVAGPSSEARSGRGHF